MRKLLVVVLSLLFPLYLNASQSLIASNAREVWTIKWEHIYPPNHPTREITFTQIQDGQSDYAVHFNNGVEGTFHLSLRTDTTFMGNLVLNRSSALPDGDVCQLDGTISNAIIKGTWHCESQHEGTFIGDIRVS